MLKKIWILAAIFLVGFASFNLLNKATEEDNAVAYQEDPVIATLREKLHEKYVGVDVKTTTEKELVLQVVANETYFNSVKKDMEAIAKSVIKTSALKDYTVVFKRWDFIDKDAGAEILYVSKVVAGPQLLIPRFSAATR